MIRNKLRNKFCARITDHILRAPLRKLAQQRSTVRGGKRKRAGRNVTQLGHAHGHGARSFAIHAGAENYDAHGNASKADASNERVSRRSSSSASAKNLQPQLM